MMVVKTGADIHGVVGRDGDRGDIHGVVGREGDRW